MSFFEKIRNGLKKTASSITAVFQGATELDDDFFDDLEERLILSDMGMPTVDYVIDKMRYACYINKAKRGDEARECLIEVLGKVLEAGDTTLKLDTKPSVILMVGVNGVGSCSARATPSARRPPSSSPSGRSAPAVRSCATRRGAIPPPWSTTASPPERRG